MTVEPFVDALLARRAHLFSSIRHHLDEVVDVDRLIARHLPGHEPLDREWMLPFTEARTQARMKWVLVPGMGSFDDEAAQAEFALVDADSDAAPPSPTAAPATVDEDRDEHAPDVLPGPPSPTIPVVPAGGDLVAAATAASHGQASPRPSERGEPSLVCDHPGCGRVFATNQARAAHAARMHRGLQVRCTEPGCDRVFPSTQQMSSHRRAHDTPDQSAEPGGSWNYAEVAATAIAAAERGESMAAAVHALRPTTTRSAAQQAISKARSKGYNIPTSRSAEPAPLPPKKPAPKSPVQMPPEGGRVIRCGTCGWQTGPSHGRDLLKHTLAEHGREPSKAERTPIIDERAA